jgi:transcription initiation factor TFIIIB Brf1 subunit/transcription initiation factor TFIIB
MAQAKNDDAATIRQIATDNDLPDSVASLAVSIYDQAIDAGFPRVGDGRELPAAVYAAARVDGEPVRPRRLAESVGVDGDDVVSDMRRLIDALPYELRIEKPDEYVKRTLEALDYAIGSDLWDTAIRMCDDATDDDGFAPSGKSASVFGAAVVYAASEVLDAGLRQVDVADAAGTGSVAIRRTYRDVLEATTDYTRDGEPGDRNAMHDTVDRVLDAAGNVPDVVGRQAHAIIDDIPDADWVTRTNPKGVGAGAAYVAAKDNRVSIPQDDVADYAGVSKGTVVSRINDIRSWRGEKRDTERRAKAIRDSCKYNEMKRAAARHDLDVGQAPSIDTLSTALASHGLGPSAVGE